MVDEPDTVNADKTSEKEALCKSSRGSMPKEVARLRGLLEAELKTRINELGLHACDLRLSPDNGDEGRGIGLPWREYERLIASLAEKLDAKRYALLRPGVTGAYPFPQARLCAQGTSMEAPLTEALAMHQGIYVNIYPLAPNRLLHPLYSRRFEAVQRKINEKLGLAASNWARDVPESETDTESNADAPRQGSNDPARQTLAQLFEARAEMLEQTKPANESPLGAEKGRSGHIIYLSGLALNTLPPQPFDMAMSFAVKISREQLESWRGTPLDSIDDNDGGDGGAYSDWYFEVPADWAETL